MQWLPERDKRWCALIALCQMPSLLFLLLHGYALHALGATVIGAAVGVALRGTLRQPKYASLLVMIASAFWLSEVFLPASNAARLLDQIVTTILVVGIWPDDPEQRVKRRLEAVLKAARRWSTGIPLPSQS